jgi:putative ABC transport system ATP-binding protein
MGIETQTAPSRENTASPVVAALREIRKIYYKPDGSVLVEALGGVDLDIQAGDYLAIMGSSGSGKSTLMNILGCLDPPTSGTYRLDDHDLSKLEDDALSEIRGRRIGFIFQAFNLISELNIVENVGIPLFYQGVPRREREARAIECLQTVGLGDRLTHRPKELSGGQQQRVAIARALVSKPAIVLADEPTGNLDSSTGNAILDLFDELNESGITLVVVTHDEGLAERCSRILRLKDGLVDQDVRGRTPR